jgi:hypothetical protein
VTQNCTAIFVGSTLIAGALVSFMTCGICVYRCAAVPSMCVYMFEMYGSFLCFSTLFSTTLRCPCCMLHVVVVAQ